MRQRHGRNLRRIALITLLALAFPALPTHAEMPKPAPLEAYGHLPVMENPVLSPSGDRYAFVASINGDRRLFVRTVDGEPLAMASVDNVKMRGIDWAGEDFVILRISETVNLGWAYGYKHELFQVVVVDLNDGEVRSLLRSPKVMNASFGIFGYGQRDGKWHIYLGTLPMERSRYSGRLFLAGGKRELAKVELSTGDILTIARSREQRARWLVGPKGRILANEQYDDIEGHWRLYAGEGRGRKLTEARDPLGFNNILGRGRTSGTLLYARADESGRIQYMETPLSGDGEPVELLPDENVKRLFFDPATRLLIGFLREGDYPEAVMFDSADQARVDAARKAFPDRSVRFVSASSGFERLIVKTEGDDDSGSWYLVDIPAGRAELLGEAYPRIQDERVGPTRMIDYTASDGFALHGVLTLPPGRAPENLPVIALPHGGPAVRDYPGFDWMAQAFASRGYAVWQPNYRGSAGYGIEYRNAGNGEWGRKMQTDISDGIEALARRGIVDPGRACIVGVSYGGYTALAGVTLQQDVYRCAVSVGGISDLPEMLKRSRREGQYDTMRYWRRFLGAESSFDDSLDERSPARLAERTDAPVLLIHGKDDVVVPIEQSERMHDALEDAGKPVEMVVLDSEDHWLSRESTRIRMLTTAAAFVKRHLPARGLHR